MKHIRLAAARHHADAVLVVQGAADLDPYYNLWTILYPTIIGMGIFPGNHYGSLFKIRGGVWDVRNEYLYATMESEAEESTMAPVWWIDEKKALDASRKQALQTFREEFVQRMKNLKGP